MEEVRGFMARSSLLDCSASRLVSCGFSSSDGRMKLILAEVGETPAGRQRRDAAFRSDGALGRRRSGCRNDAWRKRRGEKKEDKTCFPPDCDWKFSQSEGGGARNLHFGKQNNNPQPISGRIAGATSWPHSAPFNKVLLPLQPIELAVPNNLLCFNAKLTEGGVCPHNAHTH